MASYVEKRLDLRVNSNGFGQLQIEADSQQNSSSKPKVNSLHNSSAHYNTFRYDDGSRIPVTYNKVYKPMEP